MRSAECASLLPDQSLSHSTRSFRIARSKCSWADIPPASFDRLELQGAPGKRVPWKLHARPPCFPGSRTPRRSAHCGFGPARGEAEPGIMCCLCVARGGYRRFGRRNSGDQQIGYIRDVKVQMRPSCEAARQQRQLVGGHAACRHVASGSSHTKHVIPPMHAMHRISA